LDFAAIVFLFVLQVYCFGMTSFSEVETNMLVAANIANKLMLAIIFRAARLPVKKRFCFLPARGSGSNRGAAAKFFYTSS
jgi:hypothetical protein